MRYNNFLLLKENILSIQSVFLFLCAILHKCKTNFRFFIECTIKVARKLSSTDQTI